ncbi:unnamed protein product [Acanthoscelides obtectus]|uniref:Uncharacterized protein n=1 Tax=Acanthoscelides obtectus TaxID=200917 RepID=A0A9P0PCS0_ACAOB|nr:unnamed protein product [Acanthoscelides obtectus]CAK1675090.1 hypothetical protein AOBTE_LOCUS29895 [Acanthoscelides obtectus]
MNNSKKVLALANATYRQLARNASTGKEVPPRWERFQKVTKHLQMDESAPVHLKGGLGDRFLFGSTVALVMLGLGLSAETVYTLIFKK